jgi:hypothetical protein
MTLAISIGSAIDELARDPRRHIALLKQLLLHRRHVTVHRASDGDKSAILVALDAAASAWDRPAYPEAAVAAFLSSGHPDLTAPSSSSSRMRRI